MNLTERLRTTLPAPVVRRLGPAYRRVRREWQWRTCRADLDLSPAPPDGFPHAIVEHSSVLLRELSGLDMKLQHNKITNLRLASARLDGIVVHPGQRLSFWKQVGRPTARRGYLEGLVLVDGRLTAGVGGGLCQLTNLLHWMTLHTPLTVVERWRHSYDVFPDAGRTVPFASGATCAFPSLDLQIENRTVASYRLGVRVGTTDLEGEWTSDVTPARRYRVYEAAHIITNDGPGVHHRRNVLRRQVLDADGAVVDDELVGHNHALMRYDPVLGAGPVRLPLRPAPQGNDPSVSRYSAEGGLRQGPLRRAESRAPNPETPIGADDLTPATTHAFALPDHLAAKTDPALVADDERHFAAIAESLDRSIAELSERLDVERKAAGGTGQAAMDRDLEVHRLTARLRTLRRYTLDLCLGKMVGTDGTTVYVGRLGLTDRDGDRLLVDWRSPAAEPFFGATHANPMGLASRRRYRWTKGRITDYWDEVFAVDELDGHHAALDDQSAFIASLGSSRSPRMRDVLGTIQADQDAIIRAGSRGALVVDGGPGTGKTVVALHRAAYLLYADPRLGHRRGGVLFVGPHQPYLAYVADVLPSLGEEGVRTCTLRDLVPGAESFPEEPDPEVARLKAGAAMVAAIEPAVRLYEEPPADGMVVETHWSDVWLSASDWAEAFAAPDPGTPHNEARDEIWDALLAILVDKHATDDDVPEVLVHRSLAQNEDLRTAFGKAWPLLDPTDLVGDLWEVPAYLRMCAPWLGPDEVQRLQRADPRAWTVADLPLLDAARQRLGDPDASRRRTRERAAQAAERERMDQVIDEIVQHDEEGMFAQLRQEGIRTALVDGSVVPGADPDLLAGPFAHVVVDEAQELTDAEWQMLLRRCPTRSFTIVGDRAQARHGFTETWEDRLSRVGFDTVTMASLTINYRTPEEVMAEAEPVIRAVLPDANVPTSVRSTGVPVRHGSTSELTAIVDEWLDDHHEGVACVIGAPGFPDSPRVRSLSPTLAKGLEFDLVVLVDPAGFGSGIEGAVDQYVAMTRATQRLVVLTGQAGR